LTTLVKTGSTFNIPPGTTLTAGTKLWSYRGQSVKSNKTEKVNMLLTGQTINGLEYKTSTDTSLTLSYKEKDAKKIEGNEALGRIITTLNEDNENKALRMIGDELEKNIKEFYRGKIRLQIG
jgi:hypothetical protein